MSILYIHVINYFKLQKDDRRSAVQNNPESKTTSGVCNGLKSPIWTDLKPGPPNGCLLKTKPAVQVIAYSDQAAPASERPAASRTVRQARPAGPGS